MPDDNICHLSIILHEMVHHYQKNSNRTFDLDERTLWTLQERQALYYQNLFLISQKDLIIIKGLKIFFNVKEVLISISVQIQRD